jgi:hypothetical protein
MRFLEHSENIAEDVAMNAIFDACRGNEIRANVGNVRFAKIPSVSGNEYFAALYSYPGAVCIAEAIIDQWDV